MKKAGLLLAGFFFLLLSFSASAQTKTGAGYFAGKWNVLVKGTPNGDARMYFVLKKKDSTLTGVLQDSTGAELSKIDKIDLTGNKATLYFNAQGYDINLELNKKDEDHTTGTLMGMFDAEGERIKK